MIRSNDKSRLWNKIVVYMAIFIFLLIPNRVEAADTGASCIYSDKEGNKIKLVISAKNKVSSVDVLSYNSSIKIQAVSTVADVKNWKDVKEDSVSCPSYATMNYTGDWYFDIYLAKNEKTAKSYQKGQGYILTKDKPYITCTYDLTGKSGNGIKGTPINGQKITYSLLMDKETIVKELPDDVGSGVTIVWKEPGNFNEVFKNSIFSADGSSKCPTIGVQYIDNASFGQSVQLYIGSHGLACETSESSYSSDCENFNAKEDGVLSSDAVNEGAHKTTYKSCKYWGKFYHYKDGSKKYMFEVRKASDGQMQWRITEDEYTSSWADLKGSNDTELLNSILPLENNS